MKPKKIIAFLLALGIIFSCALPIFAAEKKTSDYTRKRNIFSRIGNGLMGVAVAGTPTGGVVHNTITTKDGKQANFNNVVALEQNRLSKQYYNRASASSGKGSSKITDPVTGKKMTVDEAKKKGVLGGALGTDPKAEKEAEEQMEEDSEEDDSLGMCGDAFESFTKAVNKFYATVKTLIEQVLPNPTNYIPRGWSWAQGFAKAFGAIGISLCFIFWGIGYLRSNARFLRDRNFNTIMLPFVRAGVAAALSASAFGLVQNILEGGLSLVSTIAKTQLPGKNTGEMSLESMQKVANDIGSLGLKKLLLWIEIMLATVGVKLMMFVIVGFVIVKFFKMFIYAAVAPLPIASLAGENTQQHAFSYMKALLGVILECLVICMALELFLHGIFTPAGEPVKRLIPEISGETDNGEILMGYIENVLVWMFATTAIVFGSDRLVTKAFGN